MTPPRMKMYIDRGIANILKLLLQHKLREKKKKPQNTQRSKVPCCWQHLSGSTQMFFQNIVTSCHYNSNLQ